MAITKKIWLVEFPTHQYNEDVKELAEMKRLRIIDARFKDDFAGSKMLATETPELTKKDSKKSAKK